MSGRLSKAARAGLTLGLLFNPITLRAQVQVAAPATTATGGRTLVSLTFAAGPRTTLPPFFERVDGDMRVVVQDGQPMLRASARSSFLLRLPEILPQNFTLDFDIVPKTCCLPEDIAIEGTATINQSAISANLLWHHERLEIVGGHTTTFSGKIPDDIAAALPGALTNVVMQFQGDLLRVFTNGKQVFEVPDRKFVRGRVIRVFLGGQNDTDRAVYLARFNVTATTAPLVATQATSPIAGQAAAIAPPSAITQQQQVPVVTQQNTAQNTSGAFSQSTYTYTLPPAITNFVATVGAAQPSTTGPSTYTVTFSWDAAPGYKEYVLRHKRLDPLKLQEVGSTAPLTDYSTSNTLTVDMEGGVIVRSCVAPTAPNESEGAAIAAAPCIDTPVGVNTSATSPPKLAFPINNLIAKSVAPAKTGSIVPAYDVTWSWDPYAGERFIVTVTRLTPETLQPVGIEPAYRAYVTTNSYSHQLPENSVARTCVAVLRPGDSEVTVLSTATCLDTPIAVPPPGATSTTTPRPQISNLRVSVETVMASATTVGEYRVTWTWDPIKDPAYAKYMAMYHGITVDERTRQVTVTPLRATAPLYVMSPFTLRLNPGMIVRMCVAAVTAADLQIPPDATCLETPLGVKQVP